MTIHHADFDVAVVGGGIGGSALAAAVAADGRRVLLVEKQTEYRDKIRGEVVNHWGVDELRRLGLEQILLDAGGTWVDRFVGYDETVSPDVAESAALDLSRMLPGVPGVLDVGHPAACEALSREAADRGVTVVRGAGRVRVTTGTEPRLGFEHDGVAHDYSCRLVVGADGRQSTVRTQAGITLEQTPPNSMGGGMLVEGLHRWPAHTTSIGTEGDRLYFVFPREQGLARLYLLHSVADRGRFSGPRRDEMFLDAFRMRCLPDPEILSEGRSAATSAFHPMNDAWTDGPVVEGVVLVGDAAGWTDPILGQGLCIALRDARQVRDALRAADVWSVDAFAGYVRERAERTRKLRFAASVRTTIGMTFTPEGAKRRRAYARAWPTDSALAGTRLASYKGPENVDPETWSPRTAARIAALS